MCWIGLGYPDRDCAHESDRIRRHAGDYLRLCLEQAHALGARTLVLVPTFRTQPGPDGQDAELERAAQTIGGAIDDAARLPGSSSPSRCSTVMRPTCYKDARRR